MKQIGPWRDPLATGSVSALACVFNQANGYPFWPDGPPDKSHLNPYSKEELKKETRFKVRALIDGSGWMEFETTTQFLVNGLLQQIQHSLENGSGVKCKEPEAGENLISCRGFHGIKSVVYPCKSD